MHLRLVNSKIRTGETQIWFNSFKLRFFSIKTILQYANLVGERFKHSWDDQHAIARNWPDSCRSSWALSVHTTSWLYPTFALRDQQSVAVPCAHPQSTFSIVSDKCFNTKITITFSPSSHRRRPYLWECTFAAAWDTFL
jgi:hypothetical protein